MNFERLSKLLFIVTTISLAGSVWAQKTNPLGVWIFEVDGGQNLKMKLSIGDHKERLYGEFESESIGRGEFESIEWKDDVLSFKTILGTDFNILGKLLIEAPNKASGDMVIYGRSMKVSGRKESDKIDTSPIESFACWSPDGEAVAFTNSQYGNKDIYIAWLSGEVINITNHTSVDHKPAWSPDGKTIAFISNRSGIYEIYTINLNGTEIRRLTDSELGYDLLEWSPNGKKILFTTPDGPYIMNADGTDLKKLTDGNKAAYARISPKRKHISVTLINQFVYDIATINLETLELSNLTNRSTPDFNQRWSPDGERLVWVSRKDGNPEIYTMNSDGSDERRLTNNNHKDNAPVWSKDGETIFWETRKEDKPEIYSMSSDGTIVNNISKHPASDTHPIPSPDGNNLLFTSDRAGNPKLYIFDWEQGTIKPLVKK